MFIGNNWETECSSKNMFLVIRGCERGTWRKVGTKLYVGKAKPSSSGFNCVNGCTQSAKLFQETCWTYLTLQNTVLRQPLCFTHDSLQSLSWPAGVKWEFLRKGSLGTETAGSSVKMVQGDKRAMHGNFTWSSHNMIQHNSGLNDYMSFYTKKQFI